MWNPRGLTGVIGVMLFLIAVYLVLKNAGGASSILTSGGGTGVRLITALQGR
jgi:hypothetical protein